jgi:tetratricopeptide (TPR) repeat protein
MKKLLFTLALLVSFGSFGQTNADNYMNSSNEKFKSKDLFGALEDITSAISAHIANPESDNLPLYYSKRAEIYIELKQLDKALSDMDEAILSGYLGFYSQRGFLNLELGNFYEAIGDFIHILKEDPKNETRWWHAAYRGSGIAKENLGDLNGACADWKKAAELGDTDAAKWVANQCN